MGELRDRVIKQLKDRREKVLAGKVNVIPSPFKRFRNDFLGVEQGRFYLITGNAKSKAYLV